MASLFGKNY
jgi:hypothetical protein